MSFITLTVPPDAAPGSNVQFTDPATKQTYTVAVPQGAAPGAAFQVQLAANEKRSDSDVAAAVGAAAGKMALKATVATGKATFAAAKYAHDKGWDAKVAKAGALVLDQSALALEDGPLCLAAEERQQRPSGACPQCRRFHPSPNQAPAPQSWRELGSSPVARRSSRRRPRALRPRHR